MVRPGRLDKLLYVDLPTEEERGEIVGKMCRGLPLGGEGEREKVMREVLELVRSKKCDGYSGADLASVVREAGVFALRRTLSSLDTMPRDNFPEGRSEGTGDEDEDVVVCPDDFVKALEKVPPSVSVAQRRKYESLRSKFSGLPVRSVVREREEGKGEEKLM